MAVKKKIKQIVSLEIRFYNILRIILKIRLFFFYKIVKLNCGAVSFKILSGINELKCIIIMYFHLKLNMKI